MWWRNVQLLGVLTTLAVSGCGFHPLYGAKNGTSDQAIHDQFAKVHISPIDDRIGQILYNDLQERMRTASAEVKPIYRLQVLLQQNMTGINYQKNATASGGEMTVDANWQLLDYQSGKRLAYGHFSSIDSVNYLGPRYDSVASEQNSTDQALRDISDMITDRIAVYLSSHP